FLGAVFEMVLKADEVVAVCQQVLLSQLDGGIGLPARSRVNQSDRFHGSISERVPPSARQLLDRQACFEVRSSFKFVERHGLGGHQGLVEPVILFPGQGAIDVVVASLSVPRSAKYSVVSDGIGINDRRNRVEEI